MTEVNVVGDFTHEVLENGLNIFIQRVATAPVVSMHFAVATGSMHENPAGHGLSHFLEHMIFKGSKRYPNKSDISDTVQNYGAHINAYTTKDHTNYYIDSLADCWPKMMDVLTDAVMNPLFPEEEFIPEKEVILREQSMYEDNPSYKLQQATFRQLSGNHPFGLPVIGFKHKIKEVDRDLMLDYYQRRYQPRNSSIVLVGDLDVELAMKTVKTMVENWQNSHIESTVIPVYANKECFSETDIFFDDNQARINIGYNLSTGIDQDVPILDVIETMLSGSSSGLMIQQLKKKEELAISISSLCYTVEKAGIFVCGGSTTPEKLIELEAGIFSVVEQLRSGDFSDQDIERAILKNRISYIKQLQTVSSRAQNFVNTVIDYGSPNYWNSYMDRLGKVTRADIQKIANKYLMPNQATVLRQWPEEMRSEVSKLKNKSDAALGTINTEMTHLEKSGVRFIELNQPSEQMSSVTILFPYGSFIDPIGKKGVSVLLSRVLMMGASGLSEEAFAAKLNDHGISLNISPGNNSINFSITFLPEKGEIALELLSNVLVSPNFDKRVFNREKKNIVEQLKSRERKVFSPALQAFGEAVFGKNHPYASSTEGESNSVQEIELADLKAQLPLFFDRSKTVVAATGDFSDGCPFKAEVDAIITALPFAELTQPLAIEPTFSEGEQNIYLDLKKEQAIAIVGVPGIKADSEHRHVLDLMLASLNGQSSRIFKTIREERGLAYSTGLTARLGVHPGYIALYALVDPGKAKETMELLKEELQKIADHGLTEDEFETAKLSIVSERAFESQSAKMVAAGSMLNEYYGLGYESAFNELEIIKNMDYKLFCNTVKQLINNPCKVAVTVGDTSKMELKNEK
ncbi:MAG: insulinase family protein [Lentisphaeria bacterium]|nr:insulinase family protein [Lentisphaeria bacterium]